MSPLRVAIAQQRMHWTLEENTEAIVRALAYAARASATLCVFPELALTGFHKKIAALATPEKTAPQLRMVADACAEHSICAALGAPTFDTTGHIFNSHVFINERGETIGSIQKIGLTPAEATFFASGSERPIFSLAGLRCSSVICREVEDLDSVCTQLPASSVDLIFWPGIIRPEPTSQQTHALSAQANARTIAQRTQAFIVQSNWPNSLNYPLESEFAGQSEVIDARGELLISLPRSEAGVAVFQLGACEFVWRKDEA